MKALAKVSDLVLILGSKNSSNSTRLMETACAEGTEAYLIDDVTEIDPKWLDKKETIGVSAGASAPEKLVQGVIEYFRVQGVIIEDFVAGSETMRFAEPLELMHLKRKE